MHKRQGILLEELRPNQCRYPISDDKPMLFCGQPTTHGSYCTVHHLICHKPIEECNIPVPQMEFASDEGILQIYGKRYRDA